MYDMPRSQTFWVAQPTVDPATGNRANADSITADLINSAGSQVVDLDSAIVNIGTGFYIVSYALPSSGTVTDGSIYAIRITVTKGSVTNDAVYPFRVVTAEPTVGNPISRAAPVSSIVTGGPIGTHATSGGLTKPVILQSAKDAILNLTTAQDHDQYSITAGFTRGAGQHEYSVMIFNNLVKVVSFSVQPKINVYNRNTGSPIITTTTMSSGPLNSWIHDDLSQGLPNGVQGLVEITFTETGGNAQTKNVWVI